MSERKNRKFQETNAHLLEAGESVRACVMAGADVLSQAGARVDAPMGGQRMAVIVTERHLYLIRLGQLGTKGKDVFARYPLASGVTIARRGLRLFINETSTLRIGAVHLSAANEVVAAVHGAPAQV